MEDEEEYQSGAEKIIPIEVNTLMFYGKPLVVIRLPDGRPAVSIRSLCENMQLDRKAQVRRIGGFYITPLMRCITNPAINMLGAPRVGIRLHTRLVCSEKTWMAWISPWRAFRSSAQSYETPSKFLSHVHPPRERMFYVSWASLTRIGTPSPKRRHKARIIAPSLRHPVLPITSRS